MEDKERLRIHEILRDKKAFSCEDLSKYNELILFLLSQDYALLSKQDEPSQRFLTTVCGTVKDCITGPEWVVGPDKDVDYYDALRFAEQCNVGNCSWRLPTPDEVMALITDSDKKNRIPLSMKFPFTTHYIWAPGCQAKGCEAFAVDLGNASIVSANKTTKYGYRVFAVMVN